MITISDALTQYINTIQLARSENTYRTYKNALDYISKIIEDHKTDPKTTPIETFSEEAITWTITALKHHAPSTERLYLTALTGFYEYLAGEKLADINLPRVRLLIKQRARIPGQRLPQFPKNAIENVVETLEGMDQNIPEDIVEKLRFYRDRAFLITLADTGLRVHEACNLRRGDIEWEEGRALIIGKGNRQAVIRFSRRSEEVIQQYLRLRAKQDGASGKPLGSLPLFARHDKGAGKKILPITPTTGRNIVSEWVQKILGDEAVGTITPHSFRHYFVTRVLQGSGNLKLAQELARHKNIAVTQRYAHLSDDELDKGYWEVFEKDTDKPPKE
jgi:integrase/recombinase XerC